MSKVEVNQISSQCGSTLTIGQSGDTVTLAAGATQTGFGRTGTVDWDTTAKTANFTAVSGNGYFVNTTSAAITATLPAGSAGAIVAFADYANTWDTNNLTISPNGTDKIGGVNASATVSTEGASTTFVYVDSTQGWKQINDATLNTIGQTFISATGGTVTTCGDCKIHTFTGPGTFCVSSISSDSINNQVSYMVVAGGGAGGAGGGCGGGSGASSGGGGAGGFREDKSPVTPYTASPLEGAGAITVTATAFPITVGAGGTAPPAPTSKGTDGSNSVFSTITSTGGGAGASRAPTDGPAVQNGNPGGSGGGGLRTDVSNTIGSGNAPPTTPSQGRDGGTSTGPNTAGGGGGGAICAGSPQTSPPVGNGNSGGPGGDGATTGISGSSVVYAGGGGAGGSGDLPAPHNNPGGAGGTGGGGAGGATGVVGNAGTANTGGGGGGGGSNPGKAGAAGGSGIVIIRYKYQ